MKFSHQLAKHFREIFLGGNWTWSNFKTQLSEVTIEQANTKIEGYNSIIALTYHSHYFVIALKDVLENKPLTAHDKFSFNHPIIQTQLEFEYFLNAIFIDIETTASLIENLSNEKLNEVFVEEKYGTYLRNILGTIEHAHYHLGQIVIIKKLILK